VGTFFIAMLFSPGNYTWAKNFMQSDAWKLFSQNLSTATIKILDQSPTVRMICMSTLTQGDTKAILGTEPKELITKVLNLRL
jgi:hypothetical protein